MEPIRTRRLADVPFEPGVYVMYGGRGRRHAAYVGIAGRINMRLRQHLVLRDSSVVTGTSAAGLNIDHIREIEWYLHERFVGTEGSGGNGRRRGREVARGPGFDRVALDAAELIAEERFAPALRSRGRPRAEALSLSQDASFVKDMDALFESPSGVLVVPTVADLIGRVDALEDQVRSLTQDVRRLERG